MNYAIAKVEFSPDALSDTTPTYVDVTRYCQSASWFGGVTKDTDAPQAGGATFVLKNLQRRFEPEYTSGAYYPNIVPGRRFRLTVTADGVNYSQGTYYAREWSVDYPDASRGYSVVTVNCSDGFWRLSNDTLPTLTPPDATSYADVLLADGPFAYYPLDEPSGRAMNAASGPSGAYRGVVEHTTPNPVTGDGNPSAYFPTNTSFSRAKLDDSDVFHDSGAVSCEAVVIVNGASTSHIVGGPFDTPAADNTFGITGSQAFIYQNSGSLIVAVTGAISNGHHHLAMTFDGSLLSCYLDGVLVSSTGSVGSQILSPDANEYLYIGGNGTNSVLGWSVSHAAFYDYALSSTRIKAHADAALNRGYAAQTAGTRISALATDPLWSTASIPAGSVTVAPTPQHGQPVIDEITNAASTEAPGSLFFFNDAGNPDYNTLLETWTSAATFGDSAGEIPYDSINLAYDDDLSNTATVSGPGLAGATATNAQSLADYGNRGIDQSSLPIALQSDAQLLAQTYVDRFSTPAFRCESITLNASNQNARTQILTRELGDVIRVKRRGEGGVPIDIITRILGKSKSIDVNGDLRCEWSLARGFNASVSGWRVGVTGFSEVGQTTVAG